MYHRGRTALLALSASLAIAAPASANTGETFVVTCEGVEYTITSGNGKWAVGMDTESSTHFIPVAFSFELRDAGGNLLDSDSIEKKGHRNQEKIACTFGETFVGEDGETYTFSGTATVVKKP